MSDVAPLLPANASAQERALEQVMARSSQIELPNATLWNPWTCPAKLLPTLAWALSVNEWQSDWPETYQRQVIAASIDVHRLSGTVAGLRNALRVAGFGEVEIIEGREIILYNGLHTHDGQKHHGGDDHCATFAIKPTYPMTAARVAEMRRVVALVIPARCHLRKIDFTEAAYAYDAGLIYNGSATYGTVQ